jgi:putative ABC transport system permease protein
LRNKEIGIRKVFGATMPEIFLMLSASYLKLILISMVIAVPLALVFMQRWLADFAYKTGIEIWVIVVAIVASFGLALATIFFQTYKSIRANPVKALKSE